MTKPQDALTRKVRQLDSDVLEIYAQLDSIVATQAHHSTLLAGLRADVTALQGEVAGLRADVTALQGDVTALQGDVAGLRVDVCALQGDVTALRGDVTALRSDMTGLRGDMSSVQESLVEVLRRLPEAC